MERLNEHYRIWLEEPSLDEETRHELQNMTKEGIEDAFRKDLAFGTGGMRGIVGAGTNRLNRYTVRKAVAGYADFLMDRDEMASKKGVVIAYDNRNKSSAFAETALGVLAEKGIKAYVFSDIRPTPLLSFTVRHLSAAGGIMVTASHNPPEYNGVKMYDETGCQLVPALADEVIGRVEAIANPFAIKEMEKSEAKEQGLFEPLGENLDEAYLEAVKDLSFRPGEEKRIKLVFSPLHGTGREIIPRVLEESGFDVEAVEEQLVPDPAFKTVESPNPENEAAFALAKKLGEKTHADLLVATDPDGDRLGLMCLHEGEYVFLTGNQTGAMFIDYMLSAMEEKGTLPEKGIVFNTVVTSEFGAAIAKAHGMEVESTLTGFKFIGEKMRHLEEAGKTFVMGYEESYGYVLKDITRDKDGVQAILLAAEMANHWKLRGKTLIDYLEELYDRYGYYRDRLLNLKLEGLQGEKHIRRIMETFRSYEPNSLLGRRLLAKEDYLEGIRRSEAGKERLPHPSSDVVKFIFAKDLWFVLRPSGTEPKLKIYLNVKGDTKEEADGLLDKMEEEISAIVESAKTNDTEGASL